MPKSTWCPEPTQNWGYVALWHTTDVQRLPVLGPLSAALPTFGPECRLAHFMNSQGGVISLAWPFAVPATLAS